MSQQYKHRIVIISPDKNTDYCYLDMDREEALTKFKQNEDWAYIYGPQNCEPKVTELSFDDSFMLWRNQTQDFADRARQIGLPAELVALFEQGKN